MKCCCRANISPLVLCMSVVLLSGSGDNRVRVRSTLRSVWIIINGMSILPIIRPDDRQTNHFGVSDYKFSDHRHFPGPIFFQHAITWSWRLHYFHPQLAQQKSDMSITPPSSSYSVREIKDVWRKQWLKNADEYQNHEKSNETVHFLMLSL